MAKIELFRGPLGWLFTRLGAFPVRRGEADHEALTTARTVLDQGGLLIVFPRGRTADFCVSQTRGSPDVRRRSATYGARRVR